MVVENGITAYQPYKFHHLERADDMTLRWTSIKSDFHASVYNSNMCAVGDKSLLVYGGDVACLRHFGRGEWTRLKGFQTAPARPALCYEPAVDQVFCAVPRDLSNRSYGDRYDGRCDVFWYDFHRGATGSLGTSPTIPNTFIKTAMSNVLHQSTFC